MPAARKTVIVRPGEAYAPAECVLRDIGSSRYGVMGEPAEPMRVTLPLKKTKCDFGDCLTGDFTSIRRETIYQVIASEERSTPFPVHPDVWRRTLPMAVSYIRAQRCGAKVPGVHAACHLDDAHRRDNGRRVDVTGGWHDAGDLRKLMDFTTMLGFSLLAAARNLGDRWDAAGSGTTRLLDEFRWGNRHFLKMQDADGLVWNDTAGGGPDLDNSDNPWTDSQVGTNDDRYINVSKTARTQAIFIALEAMAADVFRQSDPRYAGRCRTAAVWCWEASHGMRAEKSRPAWCGTQTGDLAWRTLAALELHRASGEDLWMNAAAGLAQQLLALQVTGFIGSQKEVRGFWKRGPEDPAPYADPVESALPPLVLLEVANALPRHAECSRWRDAVRLYLDEYAVPMTLRNAYGIVPYGVFLGSPTAEKYRPLAGELTYRYFMPAKVADWWLGMSSHLASHALLLGEAARAWGVQPYRELAWRQLDWLMGAIPFSACLMTGEGMRGPYPHSRFVGPIPGGIMNGIAGDADDEPILDTETRYDYRTTEYWSPHVAYYIWSVSALEKTTG